MNAPSTQAPNALATAFFTVLGNTSLVLATIVFGGLSMVVGWLPPRGRFMFLSAKMWSWTMVKTSGIRLRARFAAPLDPKKGYVFMANHESMMDIPALLVTVPGEVRMLAKKSLFRVPFFGWGLAAGGFIPVDRGKASAARESFAAAVRSLESGRSILLFPEETRSRDGKLLPFKAGGFLMALKTGYPIVPVGVRGTRQVRSRDSYLYRPGPVVVRYGEPIAMDGYSVRDRAKLVDEVRARIEELRA